MSSKTGTDDSKGSSPMARDKVSTFAAGGAAALYFVMAVAMGFLNKAALQKFPYSNTLLFVQMCITCVGLTVLKAVGVVVLRPLELRKMRQTLPVAFFYNANVAFALAGLQRLNIPMYQTLKRLAPPTTCVIYGLMGRGWPNKQVTVSIGLITVGTVIAGVGDFSFDMYAYSFAIMSCFLQSMYLVIAEHTGAEKDFSSTELLMYNAILSIPALALLIYATELHNSLPVLMENAHDMGFLVLVVGVSAMGSVLNYSLFLCATLNSALTTTVVGVMKAVLMTGLGFVLLGGVEVTFVNFSGIMINTMGGCYYTYVKYDQKRRKQLEEAGAVDDAGDANDDAERGASPTPMPVPSPSHVVSAGGAAQKRRTHSP